MTTAASDGHLKSASTYFEAVDSGRVPDELFAPDIEFFFPKFGVGQGSSPRGRPPAMLA